MKTNYLCDNEGNQTKSDTIVHIKDIVSFMNDCCNKILVVDDSPFNVKTLELMLEHCFNIKCDTVKTCIAIF